MQIALPEGGVTSRECYSGNVTVVKAVRLTRGDMVLSPVRAHLEDLIQYRAGAHRTRTRLQLLERRREDLLGHPDRCRAST